MNKKLKFFLFCSIPQNQKPINEYIEIKENKFFNWSLFSEKFFLRQILLLHSFFFLICFFLTFSLDKNLSLITLILIFFSVLILYFIWENLNRKLVTARLTYEESSWFDSELWEKETFLLRNDRLISYFKLKPLKKRILRVMIFQSLLILILNFTFL
jgi:hypothetical protein